MLNELEKVGAVLYQLSVVLPRQLALDNILRQMDRHCSQPNGLAEQSSQKDAKSIESDNRTNKRKRRAHLWFTSSFALIKIRESGLQLKSRLLVT